MRSLLAALLVALPLHAASAEAPPGGSPTASALPAALAEVIRGTALKDARTSILVEELATGRQLFASHPDELLNPASNMKLVTTIAALSILGPQHRFYTDLLLEKELEQGVLQGHLYLRGKGDPSLDTNRLYELVRTLKNRGLTEVKGDLVLDDAWFDAEREGPGWEQDRADSAYMAPAGALSLNHNVIEVQVLPGDAPGMPARVVIEPFSEHFELEARVITAPRGSLDRVKVTSQPKGDRQKLVVEGRVAFGAEPHFSWKRISHPPLYAGLTFKQLLKESGIKLRGRVRRGVTPYKLKPFVSTASEPLAVLVYQLNKSSQNHMTEQLLKVIGAHVYGAPGTWEKGVQACEELLAREVAIPRGTFVMRNGSGLNDVNRLSARQFVRLLRWAHRQELASELLASLPIAGVDGTTRSRMDGTDAEGRLRAKTGTLQNVTALSGYVAGASGTKYVFSILVNDFPGRASQLVPSVDALAATIAGEGRPGSAAASLAAAKPPPPDATTPTEVLKARVLTYVNLGADSDPRNARFLRSALRAERDPALRLAIAEALWRSDRADGSSARAFLEAFEATPDAFARLRAASRELPSAGPIAVRALLELAADGQEAALLDLASLSTRTQADPSLGELLATGLEQIGRTAPDELVTALEKSGEPERAATLQLLAKGLHGAPPEPIIPGLRLRAPDAPPATHPLFDATKRLQLEPNADLAAWAKSVEERLQEQLAALAATVPAAPAPLEPGAPAPSLPGGG